MTALPFNAALEQVAIRRFKVRADELRIQIGAGQMAPDAYKLHCGILRGIEEAEQMLGEALKEIQQAGRGA